MINSSLYPITHHITLTGTHDNDVNDDGTYITHSIHIFIIEGLLTSIHADKLPRSSSSETGDATGEQMEPSLSQHPVCESIAPSPSQHLLCESIFLYIYWCVVLTNSIVLPESPSPSAGLIGERDIGHDTSFLDHLDQLETGVHYIFLPSHHNKNLSLPIQVTHRNSQPPPPPHLSVCT